MRGSKGQSQPPSPVTPPPPSNHHTLPVNETRSSVSDSMRVSMEASLVVSSAPRPKDTRGLRGFGARQVRGFPITPGASIQEQTSDACPWPLKSDLRIRYMPSGPHQTSRPHPQLPPHRSRSLLQSRVGSAPYLCTWSSPQLIGSCSCWSGFGSVGRRAYLLRSGQRLEFLDPLW